MEYINEIRERCYKKLVSATESSDLEKVDLYRKIGLFLSDMTCFMKIDIDLAFDILTLLDFSRTEIDNIYPKLISYNNLFINRSGNKKM